MHYHDHEFAWAIFFVLTLDDYPQVLILSSLGQEGEITIISDIYVHDICEGDISNISTLVFKLSHTYIDL